MNTLVDLVRIKRVEALRELRVLRLASALQAARARLADARAALEARDRDIGLAQQAAIRLAEALSTGKVATSLLDVALARGSELALERAQLADARRADARAVIEAESLAMRAAGDLAQGQRRWEAAKWWRSRALADRNAARDRKEESGAQAPQGVGAMELPSWT